MKLLLVVVLVLVLEGHAEDSNHLIRLVTPQGLHEGQGEQCSLSFR